jgi:hypothetical protein
VVEISGGACTTLCQNETRPLSSPHHNQAIALHLTSLNDPRIGLELASLGPSKGSRWMVTDMLPVMRLVPCSDQLNPYTKHTAKRYAMRAPISSRTPAASPCASELECPSHQNVCDSCKSLTFRMLGPGCATTHTSSTVLRRQPQSPCLACHNLYSRVRPRQLPVDPTEL